MNRNLLTALTLATLTTPCLSVLPSVTSPPRGSSTALRPLTPRLQGTNAPSPLLPYVTTQTTAALDLAATNLPQAISSAQQTFALVTAYGSDRDADAFLQAAFARRLLLQLKDLDDDTRATLLPYLRAHDDLAKSMAFSVPTPNKAKTAYPLLARLIKERDKTVARLPNLAVAISLVHDTSLDRRVNENHATAADPVALLDYFAANESRMFFGLRNVPVDLLVYVVDTTSSIPDLTWALRNYAGNRNVGELFFNVHYDYNAFYQNTTKQVSKDGYTLPNILKDGGVCADQAYFATEVAKAIGIPSAYDHAASAEVSHAWVGFLQSDGRRAWWNFDSGRYESYRNVRGDLTDPVSRRPIPDTYVSLLAESATAPDATATLQTAAAFTDAARLLARASTTQPSAGAAATFTPPPFPPELASAFPTPPTARTATPQSALDLIEFGLRRNYAYLPGWLAVADLAKTGQMTLDQKRRWADLVQRLCGQKYPDFALAILDPMIRTVDDPAAQARLWDATFAAFQSRPDLAAQIRIRQGEVYEKQGNLARAGQTYEDVIKRYVNATPYALAAIQRAEGVLKQMGRENQVLALYQFATNTVQRPEQDMAPEFMRQSNWFKIRYAYAKKLEEAGRTQEAQALIPPELQPKTAKGATP